MEGSGSGDEVELRFVDELEGAAEFSALFLWEPEGEVYIGSLRIPRRKVTRRVDRWRGELKRRGQPPVTEDTLLTILLVSLSGEALH